MFGTVARIRPKAGQEKALVALLQEWQRTRKPKVKGAIGGYLFKKEKNPDEYILVSVWQDRQTYFANANDPEQDRWFRRVRELLQADPVWEDGEIITST
ncbi:MAG: antibiotic biosynthesis monooxygenase [Chloroflexi bacterium]|nr:antibiotic biosynthesis monooxygenase [Chloroflexota bacterium]